MESDFSRTLSDGKAGFPALLDAIEAHLARAGAPDTVVGPVLVALDEVVSNILNYGGEGGADPTVEVGVRTDGGRVAVEVADDGAAFNPLDASTPDTSQSIDARGIGGLGIHLVVTLMDDVAYDRSAGRNLLRFSKAYTPGSAS